MRKCICESNKVYIRKEQRNKGPQKYGCIMCGLTAQERNTDTEARAAWDEVVHGVMVLRAGLVWVELLKQFQQAKTVSGSITEIERAAVDAADAKDELLKLLEEE